MELDDDFAQLFGVAVFWGVLPERGPTIARVPLRAPAWATTRDSSSPPEAVGASMLIVTGCLLFSLAALCILATSSRMRRGPVVDTETRGLTRG